MISAKLEGLDFLVGARDEVTNFIFKQITGHTSFVLLPTSLNDIASINGNLPLTRKYQEVDYCLTDGMPLVWWFNLECFFLRKKEKIQRLYGPTLMRDILGKSDNQVKHFLYGSSPQTITNLAKEIIKLNPSIKIVGKISPPFGDLSLADEASFLAEIRKVKADVLWIGLSSPKQVYLATRWKHFLPQVGVMCVGAAFDFLSKKQPMAPRFVQKVGLEWLFRLFVSPKRLWKRYLILIPIYLFKKLFSFLTGY